MMPPSIYEYIKKEESNFQTNEIQVGDNWYWNLRNHVQMIFHLKNGVFFTGENNWLRTFKNRMQPILNLSYWTEDIEVKDVVFYIENQTGKVLSFLVKKFYEEVYLKEHDLDVFFDELTESDIDYGGALVQKGKDVPEVLQLNSIAFCDQTDILGGPLAFKHFFSPSKLKSMEKMGWGSDKNGANISVNDLITLASFEKSYDANKKENEVSGKSIEVYIVKGDLPKAYLDDSDNMEDYVSQIQIIAFYTNKDSKKEGVTLYRKEENDESIMFHTSKKVYQRALGQGIGETLLHPQIWTNFLSIHKTNLLEAASKVPLYTDDQAYQTKNRIQDMENLEITTIEEGKRIFQVPTSAPVNIQLYDKDINDWYEQAQLSGAAFDPLIGKEASSGTTFRGQERSVAQGRGIHDRRRGQRAKFIEEVYRKWIIPDIKKEITKGRSFLATLSTDELTWVADQMSTKLTNDKIKEVILRGGDVPSLEEANALVESFKKGILKKGNKQIIEVLKDEFSDVEIKMGINIAGKQKDLVQMSDKLLSIFQFIFQNPQGFQQAMQVPALAKSFENILEYGGMSIGDFSSLIQSPQPQVTNQLPKTQTSAIPSPITPGLLPQNKP